jgi:HSP20 family molecular chaperone IbpA
MRFSLWSARGRRIVLKVSPDQDPKAYLSHKNEGLRDQIIVKEREIAMVKELYDKKIADQQRIGEEKLYQQYDLNQAKLAEEIQQNEARLEELRANLAQTENYLESERQTLNEVYSEKNQELAQYREQKFQAKTLDAEEETWQIRQEASNALNELRADLDWKVQNARLETQRAIQEAENKKLETMAQTGISGQDEIRKMGVDHSIAMTRQRLENELALDQEKRHLESVKTEREKQLEAELNEKTLQYEHLSSRQEHVFQARYDQLVREHEELFETTRQKLGQQYDQMVEQLTAKKAQFEERSQDQFYRVNTLEPELTEDLNSYTVKIQVPEHEKEQVTLAPHGRQLKLNLVRNFKDEQRDENGSLNKASRSEVFTKIMNVPEIVNSRDVTQRYVDGVLEFRVAKL